MEPKREKYVVKAIVMVPCEVVVLGHHIGEALDRFQKGAWYSVNHNFDDAYAKTATSIRLMEGQ